MYSTMTFNDMLRCTLALLHYCIYPWLFLWIIICSDRRPETKQLSKELKEKLLGSDREGLGIGLGLA